MKKKRQPQARRAPAPDPGLAYIAPGIRALAVPLSSLRADPRNPRSHGEVNLDQIRSSLHRFGQQKPVVARADGTLVAGNGTLQAAAQLGWTHLAAVATPLEGAEASAYALADNRSSDLGGWDDAALAGLVAELREERFPVEALLKWPWEPAPGEAPAQAEAGQRRPRDDAQDRKGKRTIRVTEGQYETISRAVAKLRIGEGDLEIPEGRALELICADWMA